MKVARLFASTFVLVCLLFPSLANAAPPYSGGYGATEYVTTSATITYIFALSTSATGGESNVHVVQPGASVQAVCNGRLYILGEDKEQFAAALAAKTTGTAVRFYYTTAAPAAYGYYALSGAATCKVIAIYY